MGNRETALITGATSGIGYAFAEILAQRGYDLFLASRNRSALDGIKIDFESRYAVAVAIMPVDLSSAGSALKVYEQAAQRDTEVAVLINNAGFGLRGTHANLPLDAVSAMLHLNITTLTELCTLFGKAMQARRKGHILNVASTAAYQPVPYLAAYSATKSYVLQFSEALAKEMEDDHVVVTCLSPGPTRTGFFERAGIGERQKGLWANQARMSPETVAMIGIQALFAKKLSVVAGFKNALLAFSNRFAPRRMAAAITKKVVQRALDIPRGDMARDRRRR